MATAAEVQDELDPQGTGKLIKIEKQFNTATKQWYFCLGGQGLAGRARWIECTTSDNAATQATAITNGMA
jgi:hypothetical protein